MSLPEIVFIDFDGTLYQSVEDIVQPSSIEAVRLLKELGIQVWAATGRPWNMCEAIAGPFEFDGYVLINGGYVLDRNLDIISASPIDPRSLQDLIHYAIDQNLGLMMHTGKETRIALRHDLMLSYCQAANFTGGLVDDHRSFPIPDVPVYNAVFYCDSLDQIQPFLSSHPDLRHDVINVDAEGFTGFAVDIFPAGNDKAGGVEAALSYQHLDWSQSACIGDSSNDLGMISRSACGIAMGSASKQVKEAAAFVTASVYEDGVAKAILHLLEMNGIACPSLPAWFETF